MAPPTESMMGSAKCYLFTGLMLMQYRCKQTIKTTRDLWSFIPILSSLSLRQRSFVELIDLSCWASCQAHAELKTCSQCNIQGGDKENTYFWINQTSIRHEQLFTGDAWGTWLICMVHSSHRFWDEYFLGAAVHIELINFTLRSTTVVVV